MTSDIASAAPLLWRPAHDDATGARRIDPATSSKLGWREVCVLAGLLAAYSLARLLSDTELATARDHASGLLGVERFLGIDIEADFTTFVASHRWWAVLLSFWYATLHYLITGWALWLSTSGTWRYSTARIALVAGSAFALLMYILVPMAPPRLMPEGYVDVLALTADVGWWSGHASAPAGLGDFTNEVAAMPSLHVGWAFWVLWAMWPAVGRIGRTLGVFYALGTATVVVGTGNHWILDGLAGVLVMTAGIVVAQPATIRANLGFVASDTKHAHRQSPMF